MFCIVAAVERRERITGGRAVRRAQKTNHARAAYTAAHTVDAFDTADAQQGRRTGQREEGQTQYPTKSSQIKQATGDGPSKARRCRKRRRQTPNYVGMVFVQYGVHALPEPREANPTTFSGTPT